MNSLDIKGTIAIDTASKAMIQIMYYSVPFRGDLSDKIDRLRQNIIFKKQIFCHLNEAVNEEYNELFFTVLINQSKDRRHKPFTKSFSS